jgi:hypothetical protein
MEKGLEVWRYSKGVQVKLETQSKSTLGPPRSPIQVDLESISESKSSLS